MMTRDQAQTIVKKILSDSTFPDCSVIVADSEEATIRFANNGVTTAGFTNERTITITSTRDKRSGESSTSETDDAALKAGNPQRSPRLSAGERRSMLAYGSVISLAAIARDRPLRKSG